MGRGFTSWFWRGTARLNAAAVTLLVLGPAAFAEEPVDWQFGMQAAASPVRDRIDHLHDVILLPIITAITVFVLGLLCWVMWRFRASAHPVPTKTTHNTVIELLWTTVPILILIFIAVPSFSLLYYGDRTEKADFTLKVKGHQWNWSYEYPDQGVAEFTSQYFMAGNEEAPMPAGHKRLLDVDEPIVLPVGEKVRIEVSGTDVIHSWFVPALGVQTYAVAGHSNETWTEIERKGVFYGQCNQICGLNHPFMPIEIIAVEKPVFEKWVACMKEPPPKGAPTPPPGHCSQNLATADGSVNPAPIRVAAQTGP